MMCSAASAWHMGEYEVGKWATEMSLRVQPNNEILKQKLIIYEAQIAKTGLPTQAIISHATAVV